MAADGSIIINTKILTDGFETGVKSMKNGFNGLNATLKKFGMIVGSAFAVKKLVDFGKEAIELGSDLQEVENVVDSVFTTMSDKVDEFARKAAQTAGLSETMAKKYTGTFGAMAKSFGFTEQQALDMSTSLTQLTGDLASFYNISQDEAYTKLKSVFTGETESLKELGVVMTQTALDSYALANGFGKTTSAMTEQEKVALRLRFVTEQLSTASGDFLRTSDGWANQIRVMQLQVTSLKATIGQGLINIFTPVIKVINTLLAKLATVANAFKAFTELVTGKKSSGTTTDSSAGLSETEIGYSMAADSAQDLADATNNVAKATKNARKEQSKYLSGLDEVRRYESDIYSDSSTTPSTPGGNIITTPITGGAAVMEVDYGQVAEGETVIDKLADKVLSFKNILETMFEPFERAWKNKGQDVIYSVRYALDNIGGMIGSIGRSWMNVWNGTGERTLSLVMDITSNLVRIVGNLARQFKKAWDTNEVGTAILQAAADIINTILRFTDRIVDATRRWAENVDFYPLLESIRKLLEAIQPVVRIIGDFLAEIYEDIILPLGKYLIEKALPKILDMLTELMEFIADHEEGVKTFGKVLLGAFASAKIALKVLAIKKSLETLIGAFTDVRTSSKKVTKSGSILTTVLSGLNDIAGKAAGEVGMLNTSIWGGVFALGGGIIGTVALTEKLAALVETAQGGNGVLSDMGATLNDLAAELSNTNIVTEEQQASIRALVDANEDMNVSAAEMASSVMEAFRSFGVSSEQLGAVLASTGSQFSATAENAEILNSLVKTLGEGYSETAGIINLSSIELQDAFKGIKSTLTDMWREGTLADDIFYELDYTLSEMKASGQTAQTALDSVVAVLEDAGIPTEGFIQLLGEKLPEAVVTVEGTTKEAMEGTAKAVEDNMKAAEDSVTVHTEEMAKNAESSIGNIETEVVDTFGNTSKSTESNWNASDSAVETALNAMKTATSNSMRSIFKNVESYTNSIWNITANNWDAIALKIENVLSAMSGNISGMFQNMRTSIVNELNQTISYLNYIQSAATAARNRVAKALTFEINFPEPISSFVGYSRIGMRMSQIPISPSIPYLATGAVIPPNAPFMAVLGDQRHGNNIEAPEGLIRKIIREETAHNSGGGQYRFTAQINRRTLFDEFMEEAKLRQMQTGRNPLDLA